MNTYSDWGREITEAERRMQDRLSEWRTYLDFYRTDLESAEALEAGLAVYINYHFSTIRNILSSVYFRNPDILVSPRFSGGYDMYGEQGKMMVLMKYKFAKARQKLLQYQVEKMKFQDEARRVIFDALVAGYGVVKLGYKPRMDSLALGGEKSLGELDVDALLAMLEDEEAAEKKEEDASYEPNQRVSEQNPFSIRISPAHFYVDPAATHLEEARWVVHCVLRPLEDVKEDSRYKRSVVDGMKGTRRITDEKAINEVRNSGRNYSSDKEHDAAVMLYEIWDLQNKRYLVIDEHTMMHGGSDKEYLIEDDWPYDCINGFPFEILTFNLDPDHPFGLSDVKTWHNPALSMNLVTSMRFNHVKRFNRKYETAKGNLDPEEMTKLTSPADGTVVQSQSTNKGPSIFPIPDAPMSGDIYAYLSDTRREMDQLSGVTAQRQGQSVGEKTATEASFMEAQSSRRDDDRLGLVTAFVENIVTKLDQLNVAYLDRNYAAFVTDPETAMVWQEHADEILRMQADVKVRVGSSGYKSKEVQVQQMLKFLNLTGQLVDPMTNLPIVNVRAVIVRLAEMIDLEAPEDFILPMAPPPMQGGPPPGMGGPGGQQPPGQRQNMQNGPMTPNMGAMLSEIQNGGAVGQGAPNPRMETGRQ
jgi:hypothetical protein